MKRRMLEITFQAIQRAQLPEKYSLAQETSSSITHSLEICLLPPLSGMLLALTAACLPPLFRDFSENLT